MKVQNKITLSWVVLLVFTNFVYAKDAKIAKDLQTVTVTAQKVEEKLQDVPISASVANEYDIEDNNIETLSDVAKIVPNFISIDSGMNILYSPIIRGLYADPETSSSIVGTYVDGIPYYSFGNNIDIQNIQRIEVLRGPQSTLYGKYAYAGTINIITKQPTNETSGYIKGTLGSDGKRKISAGASGAIVKDKLFISVSGSHDEKEGYIKNAYLNTDSNYKENDFAKLYLRFLPTENLEFSLISSYFQRDDGGFDLASAALEDPRKSQGDFKSYTKPTGQAHALKITYNYNDIDFSSITTYKKIKPDRMIDFDDSPTEIFHAGQKGEYEDYSQEFRINGEIKNFKWLVGWLLNEEKNHLQAVMSNGTVFSNTKNTTKGIGVFANGDYSFTDNWSLSAGLRYDRDEVSIKDYLSGYEDEKSFDAFSPKIGLKYNINQDISTYVTVAKGYKSGGFFIYAPEGNRKFDKEDLTSYEIGLKTKSFNDRLLINFAAFYMDIKDMQARSSISPTVAYISNAGTATSKGLEIETTFKATMDLEFFANLGYTDMKYDKYSDSLGDYSGNRGQFAPKFDYYAGVKYRNAMGIFAQFDVSGQSSFYTDKENTYKNDGYTLLNAKIGYEAENFEVYLYCNNITDKKYDIYGYLSGSYTIVSPPREFGLEVAYRF